MNWLEIVGIAIGALLILIGIGLWLFVQFADIKSYPTDPPTGGYADKDSEPPSSTDAV